MQRDGAARFSIRSGAEMTLALVVVLLAAEPTADVKPVEHGAGNAVALVGSTVGLLGASTIAAVASGIAIHGVPLSAIGRPSPWATGVGVLVGLALQFTISHLAVPWVASRLRPEHDLDTIREKTWVFSRWPMAAGALGALTFGVGAALEETRWGRGDGVMAAGIVVTLLSLLVFDVIEGIATWGAVR